MENILPFGAHLSSDSTPGSLKKTISLAPQLSKAWPMDSLITVMSPRHNESAVKYHFLQLKRFDTLIHCADAQMDSSTKCFKSIKPQCVKDLKT